MKKEDLSEEELSEKELEEYAGEIWNKGSFVQSISSEELEKKKKTIEQSHNEDMNYICKKCNKKISAHNKDWHDNMCDDCFNETYFPKNE